MAYRDYIEELKKKWVGNPVFYDGAVYKVIGVDYNGGILINKADEFKGDCAVPEHLIRRI